MLPKPPPGCPGPPQGGGQSLQPGLPVLTVSPLCHLGLQSLWMLESGQSGCTMFTEKLGARVLS